MPKLPGDPAPWFIIRSTNNESFHFDTSGGLYIVLCFYGSSTHPVGSLLLNHTLSLKDYYDDDKICFFGVSADPDDEKKQRVTQRLPGIRYFWDFDKKLSNYFEITNTDSAEIKPRTIILDPLMRILANIDGSDPQTHNKQLSEIIHNLPNLNDYAHTKINAPVLILPRVFEPEFCKELIGMYEKEGGQDSGFMRDVNQKTVGIIDYSFKKRFDYTLTDKDVLNTIKKKIGTRIIPEIMKAFQFEVSYIERYIISCYDAKSGGYFNSHRDNTTKATAHRKFAVTINLNAEEYEGGNLMFPEFGTHTYRAPTGGAVVFSCSLLHKALPVTKGKRYAFLPFLFDKASEKVRMDGQKHLANYKKAEQN